MATYGVDLVYNTKDAVVSLNRLSSGALDVDVALKKSGQSADYLFHSLKRIVTYSAIFSGFAMLIKLVDSVAETELRLAEVQTLLERGNEEQAKSFELVKRQLMAMDPHLGTTVELVKGLYEIMSAGVNDPAEAMILLNTAAQYAKVGLTDLKTSAEMLTSVMKAYGFSATEMIKVTDVLFASVAQGKFHAEDLNSAIGNVIPTAAAMGVTIQEVSAMLAFLSNRGLSASESATALNRMLLSILRPTNQAKDAFNRLGIEWGINAFKGESFTAVMEKLVNATARYPEMLGVIFRRETGLRAMFSVSSDMTGYLKILDRMNEEYMTGGVVADGYRKVVGTVKEEIKALWASMGQAANAFLGFTGTASEGIRVFSVFVSSIIRNAEVVGGFAAAYMVAHRVMTTMVRSLNAVKAALVALQEAELVAGVSDVARNQALNRSIANYTRLASVARFASTAIMVGVGVYILAKTALDSWNKSMDEEMDRMTRGSIVRRDMIRTLKDLTEAYYGNMEEYVRINQEAKKMSQVRVFGFLSDFGQKGTWMSSSGEIMRGYSNLISELDKRHINLSKSERESVTELMDFLQGTNTAGKSVSDFSGIIATLASQLGITDQVYAELLQTFAKTPEGVKFIMDMSREVSLLTKGINVLYGKKDALPMEIALELDKDSIKKVLDIMDKIQSKEWMDDKGGLRTKTLAALSPDLIKFVNFLENSAATSLATYRKRFQEAFNASDTMNAKQKLQEFTEQVESLASASYMNPETANMMAQAMKNAFDMRPAGESVLQFANDTEPFWKKILNNIDQVTNVGLKKFILSLEGTVRPVHDLERAVKSWASVADANFNRVATVLQEITKLENDLHGTEYNNVVAANKKRSAEYARDYKEQLDRAIKSHQDLWVANVIYFAQMAQLRKLDVLAQQDAEFKKAEAAWKRYEQDVELMEMTKEAKAKMLEMERDYEAAVLYAMGAGQKEVDELIRKYNILINKYRDVDKATKESYLKWESLGRAISSISTLLKDLVQNLGLTTGWLKLTIDIVDGLTKGYNAVLQSIKAYDSAYKEWLKTAGEGGKVLEDSKEASKAFSGSLEGVAGIAAQGISILTLLFDVVGMVAKAFDEASMDEAIRRTAAEWKALGIEIDETTAKMLTAAKQGMAAVDDYAKYVMSMNMLGLKYVSKAEWEKQQSFLNLPKVIDAMGVSTGNMAGIWARLGDIIDAYNNKIITAKQAQDALGKSWTALLEGLKALGKEGSKAQTDFILKLRESKLYVKEVAEYIDAQLGIQRQGFMSAAQGLEMMAIRGIAAYDKAKEAMKARGNAPGGGGGDLTDPITPIQDDLNKAIEDIASDLKRIENLTMATFNAMIENGASYVEAINSIGPALDAIIRKREILAAEGIITDKNLGVDALIRFRDIVNKNKELFDSIAGNLAVMKALTNTASMNQDIFNDSQKNAVDYFNKLKAAGMTQDEALKAMAPNLNYILYLHKEYGYAIDAETQALIDQARASGMLEEDQLSMVDAILGGIGLLCEAFGVVLPGAMQDAVNKLRDIKSDTDAAAAAANELGNAWERAAGKMPKKLPPGPYIPPWDPNNPPVITQTFGLAGGGSIPVIAMDNKMDNQMERLIGAVEGIADQKIEGVVIPRRDEDIINFVKTKLERGEWTVKGVSAG